MWPSNKSCAFAQGKKDKEGNRDYIRKYSLDTLSTAMKEDGKAQHVYDADFLYSNQAMSGPAYGTRGTTIGCNSTQSQETAVWCQCCFRAV
jgi:hypothetical protein